jgi:hypothetical protein
VLVVGVALSQKVVAAGFHEFHAVIGVVGISVDELIHRVFLIKNLVHFAAHEVVFVADALVAVVDRKQFRHVLHQLFGVAGDVVTEVGGGSVVSGYKLKRIS